MKFKEEKKPGLLGQSAVFTQVGDDGKPVESPPFQIIADQGGIRFTGNTPRLDDMVQLRGLAQTIDKAWRLHRAYRPKVTNQAGH